MITNLKTLWFERWNTGFNGWVKSSVPTWQRQLLYFSGGAVLVTIVFQTSIWVGAIIWYLTTRSWPDVIWAIIAVFVGGGVTMIAWPVYYLVHFNLFYDGYMKDPNGWYKDTRV